MLAPVSDSNRRVIAHDTTKFSIREMINPLRGLTVQVVVRMLEDGRRGIHSDVQWLYDYIEEREAVMMALVFRRGAALKKCQWRIEPTLQGKDLEAVQADSDAQRTFLADLFGNIENMREAISWLGMATFRGFAHLEHHYDDAGKIVRLQPVEGWFFNQRYPYKRWLYNAHGTNAALGVPIDPQHWTIREVRPHLDAYAAIKFVQKGVNDKDWHAYCSRFGLPNVFFESPEGTTPEQIDQFAAKAAIMANDGRGALPPGVKATMTQTSSSDGTPFPGRQEYIDTMLILAGTGGKLTMLSDPTGVGQGATVAHEDVFQDIADAEGEEIADVFMKSIGTPALNLAFPGKKHLVKLAISRRTETDKLAATNLLRGLRFAGWDVSEEEAEEMTGLKLTKRMEILPGMEGGDAGGLGGDSGAMNRRLLNAGQAKIRNDMDMVWAAMRADTAEVIDRLQAALSEDDKAKRDAALNRLNDDLPMLLSEMNTNPETAIVLERIFAEASARGITT